VSEAIYAKHCQPTEVGATGIILLDKIRVTISSSFPGPRCPPFRPLFGHLGSFQKSDLSGFLCPSTLDNVFKVRVYMYFANIVQCPRANKPWQTCTHVLHKRYPVSNVCKVCVHVYCRKL